MITKRYKKSLLLLVLSSQMVMAEESVLDNMSDKEMILSKCIQTAINMDKFEEIMGNPDLMESAQAQDAVIADLLNIYRFREKNCVEKDLGRAEKTKHGIKELLHIQELIREVRARDKARMEAPLIEFPSLKDRL